MPTAFLVRWPKTKAAQVAQDRFQLAISRVGANRADVLRGLMEAWASIILQRAEDIPKAASAYERKRSKESPQVSAAAPASSKGRKPARRS